MPNPWVIVGALVALLGSFGYGYQLGAEDMDTEWTAKYEKGRADAVTEALKAEREENGRITDALRKERDEVIRVNDTLHTELDGLRNRPPRIVRVPGETIHSCEGATGAELSRPDAEFLTRLAARADRLRAALKLCYSYSGGGD